MTDFIIRNSDSCWDLDGKTICNIVIDRRKKSKDGIDGKFALPTTLLFNGKIKKVKDVKSCWHNQDGKEFCLVKASGKDGGKTVLASAMLGDHYDISTLKNEKCDPKKDPYCKVK